jgi:hypothetical protein
MTLQMILAQADVIAALQEYVTSLGHQMDATVIPVINTTNYTITVQLNS